MDKDEEIANNTNDIVALQVKGWPLVRFGLLRLNSRSHRVFYLNRISSLRMLNIIVNYFSYVSKFIYFISSDP